MSTIIPLSHIKAYFTNSKEESCVKLVKPSEVRDIALAALKAHGMVPFYYGISKTEVYLGIAKVTYVVNSQFIETVKALAEKKGIAVSLQEPKDIGIHIHGNSNASGIILVKSAKP